LTSSQFSHESRGRTYICATGASRAVADDLLFSLWQRGLARSGTAVASRPGMIVSFLGTKGGTGTTTLAV